MNTDDESHETSQPERPRQVKRGAFPTPKSEIAKAPVFVPPDPHDPQDPQDRHDPQDPDDRPQPAANQSPADPDDADTP